MFTPCTQFMARSILKSVRIKEEDWKTLSENKISFDQEFVHNCVLQLKDRHDNRDEVLSVVINNAPSFLFTNTATNEEIYSYLKENKNLFNKKIILLGVANMISRNKLLAHTDFSTH